MSFENSLWGATKIHGELLKLGIAVAQSTVSVYIVPRRARPLQTWKTFLRNHMEGIASIDLFVVPTIAFEQLFAFLVLGRKRRQLCGCRPRKSPQRGLRAADNRHPLEKLPRAPKLAVGRAWGHGERGGRFPSVMGGLSRPP